MYIFSIAAVVLALGIAYYVVNLEHAQDILESK